MLNLEDAVTPMSKISYLVGSKDFFSKLPINVFNYEVCEFLYKLSSLIFSSKFSRIYPDLASIGFYCRKANILKLKNKFNYLNYSLGRGVCFHITPSNIPSSCAYSYIFGLLSGNSNIVRVSSKEYPQIDILCSLINSIIHLYPKVRERTLFIRYPKDNDISQEYSLTSDVRMIWGGDNTIEQFCSYKTKTKCVDLKFADRYSLALIDCDKVKDLSDFELVKLAENFYKDTFLVDQNACSSPQLVLWLNCDKNVKKRFWKTVFDVTKSKYVIRDSVAVDKYTLFCRESIENTNFKSFSKYENLIYLEEIKSLTEDLTSHRGNCGYFWEYSLEKMDCLCSYLTEKVQTITYFGINPDTLCNILIENNVLGVDRIVPTGNALNMNSTWDGYDILKSISRTIFVENQNLL